MKSSIKIALSFFLVLTLLTGCAQPLFVGPNQPLAEEAAPSPAAEAPTPVPTPAEEVVPAPVEEMVPTAAGTWTGAIAIAGVELEIVVTLAPADDGWTGTIDIPQQGAAGIPLHTISVDGQTVHFEMLDGPQTAVFDGELGADGTINGVFAQAGMEGSFALAAQMAEETAGEESPAEAAIYTSPDGLFTVPIPTNWTAEQMDDYGLLTGPEGALKVYVLAVEAESVEAGVEAAWALIDPTFDAAIDEIIQEPTGGRYDEAVTITYDLSEENKANETDRIVIAGGWLLEGMAYVEIFDTDVPTLQRRISQVQIISSGFDILATTETDLSVSQIRAIDADLLAELEAYIVESLARYQVPGAAVAIVQDGEVIYAQGFGTRGPDTDEPITPDTQMLIGSTSKTMTTMMMATLVDDGLMEWETPVVEILPSFAVADPEITQRINISNMVCACTGVPRRDFELIFNSNELSAEDIIDSLATFEFFTDFGEAFQYSNQMVAAGGYVAAAAAGGEVGNLYAAYDATMQERILDPIGMTDTTLSFADVLDRDNYALPHGLNMDMSYTPIPLSVEEDFLAPIAPAGAYWSTVLDMAKYLITELNTGVSPDGSQVVSAENLGRTWQPQVAMAADVSYGLGWIIDAYKSVPMIHHGGNTLGYTSDLAFLPTEGIGISVLSNGRVTNFFNEGVRYRLLELIYDQEMEADESIQFGYGQIRDSYAEALPNIMPAPDAESAAPLLGTFVNDALGSLILTFEDGTLMADVGEFQSELRPFEGEGVGENIYIFMDVPVMGAGLQFTFDEAGTPTITMGGGATEYVFTLVE